VYHPAWPNWPTHDQSISATSAMFVLPTEAVTSRWWMPSNSAEFSVTVTPVFAVKSASRALGICA